MKIEDYQKAKEIMAKIDAINKNIYDLKDAMRNGTLHWRMEIRPNTGCPSFTSINHCGLLPKFLDMAYDELVKKRNSLTEELDRL